MSGKPDAQIPHLVHAADARGLLCGRATSRRRLHGLHARPERGPNAAGVVFVANGSGDYRTVSDNMSRIMAEARLPLQVEPVIWSLGYRRTVADHVDHANQVIHGRLLAERVTLYRQLYPGRKVYLVGYSSGCAVILAAAEALPPGSVDRIVLLAPSVCSAYDLRPALRTSRCGIDSFHSERDRVILGFVVGILGTSDQACRAAAGRCGFTPVVGSPGDAALYTGLRQHPWDPAVAWSGNDGGHFGTIQIGFLRAYALPLLARD
jgi:pimeloyl-ACP methyl ester carboxylesterase